MEPLKIDDLEKDKFYRADLEYSDHLASKKSIKFQYVSRIGDIYYLKVLMSDTSNMTIQKKFIRIGDSLYQHDRRLMNNIQEI